MSAAERSKSPSTPSSSSLNHTGSLRSNVTRRPPPPISTVITTPPWARDEPPSPKENASFMDSNHATASRPSDAVSYDASTIDSKSRWWTFTMPRHHRLDSFGESSLTASPKRAFRDLSKSWLPTSSSIKENSPFGRKEKEKATYTASVTNDISEGERGMSISIPAPVATYTTAQAQTPGWDVPWSPRMAAQGPVLAQDDSSEDEGHTENLFATPKPTTKWKKRRKTIRNFILTNVYVPLLFRMINIAFTSAALAIALFIRRIEIKGKALGAVGSSPTLVIIFAPMTLVHVMVAVYLEYFGRPLGLWRTSGKLTHTLSEVIFICAWSAALSLCFDNYFTSLIPCASARAMSWYNEIPRPASTLPNFEGSIGEEICDNQLVLICLVGIGLLAYCANLVISLFRIFEKVKYHPAQRRS